MIETLRSKLLAERRRNLVQEMEIRKEMGDAMFQQLMESEELRRWFFCTPLGPPPTFQSSQSPNLQSAD